MSIWQETHVYFGWTVKAVHWRWDIKGALV